MEAGAYGGDAAMPSVSSLVRHGGDEDSVLELHLVEQNCLFNARQPS